MQNYIRLYDYIQEYRRLIYDTYSKNSIAYLCTYFNLNKESTVWDNTDLMNGSYERIGALSGMKWNKILILPVFFVDEINTVFDGKETGYLKDNETSITIPSSYGITPYPGDIIKFEQSYLQSSNDTYPLYIVQGLEISANTEKRFWKLKLSVFQSFAITDLENQTENIYSFFDYDKKIHTLNDAEFLTKILIKNELLRSNLKNLFDQNSGFYLM